MKPKNYLQYLLIVFICISAEMKAEYSGPFIIKDKNGYANIHKEADGNSKIEGKVYQCQLLYLNSFPDFDDEGNKIIENYTDSIWIPVFNDSISGYIHKKNILPIWELPSLPIIKKLENSATSGTIICMNNDIKISMEVTPFDTITDLKELIKHEHCYCYGMGSDYAYPYLTKKLNKIIIDYNAKKIIFTKDKFQNYYCEIKEMDVFVGKDGELYISFSGTEGVAEYVAWITIMNDNILFEFVELNL
jgi:hypothetical protein